MRSLLSAVFLVLAVGAANPQQEQGAMTGVGMTSCAEFAQKYRDDPNFAHTLYFVWAQGFMSGLNLMQLALKGPMHDLNGWPFSQQQLHIRTFCDQRPLSTVAQAVRSVFNALPEIQPKSK